MVELLLRPIYRLYSWFLWRQIKDGKRPTHIGVILDGNRRYGQMKGLPPFKSHEVGAKKVEEFIHWVWDLGIKVVTLYTFSMENFRRSKEEVEEIMNLAKEYFYRITKDERIHKYKVRVRAIGRIDLLPKDVREAIRAAEESTKGYNNYFLNIAIGYGGRAEIVDAVRRIAKDIKKGLIEPDDIGDKVIEKYLYTSGLPDPDLIIRTSGEERLSGFLLWQSAYSELFFCEVYWPEFRKIDLWRAIRTYQRRKRRFGK
ncbi:MAG: polyprenyl diphosphate synthase [Candidatus Asgardarchaeia archaeon]